MSEVRKTFIDFTIRSAWHRVSRMYNQQAGNHGITMSYGFILMLVEKEGTPSTQLGPKMGMEPTSLSRTLNAMENDGLIHRSAAADDKRKVLIFLTKQGVERRRQIRAFLQEFNNKLQERVSDEELTGFYKVIGEMETLIEEQQMEK
ncbi:MAG: hypothetical protein RL264_103 [Bacteroidota bacterium]|jgi:DNA-binding MarR family transcriptional regulator